MDISRTDEGSPRVDTSPQHTRTPLNVTFASSPQVFILPSQTASQHLESEAPAVDSSKCDGLIPRLEPKQLPPKAEAFPTRLIIRLRTKKLNRPKEPTTSFKPRSHPPFEPKVDKEYVIYVPYTFEELKPHFTSHNADAKQLFCTLTGNVLPRTKSPNYDYEMWANTHLPIYAAYNAFANDFARGDISASRIPSANGTAKEWTRLEFGRELWNRGQNYSQDILKAKAEAQDSTQVKKMLVAADLDHREMDIDEDNSDTEIEIVDDNDKDGEWKPSSKNRKR